MAIWANILISIAGAIIAFSMLIEMIKVLKSGNFGVDLLAIISVTATIIAQDYWAALIILIMLTGGDSLEDFASKKASADLSMLLDNSPKVAHIITDNTIKDVAADEVPVGSTILIKPGEVVPVDGIISEGTSSFDESSMTGESLLIKRSIGDHLISGALNTDRPVNLKTEKLAQDSQYQTLVNLVKTANLKPARFVRLADQYALPFTIISILIGVIAAIIAKDPHRFVQVVVVASPCPLILAAPVAIVSGMSRVTRHGIILKTGTALEKLAKAKSAYFDKTGTLTQGELAVKDLVSTSNLTKPQLVQLFYNLEINSNHVMGKAITNYAQKEKATDSLEFTEIKEITGQGIEAHYGEQLVKIGALNFATKKESELAKYAGKNLEYSQVFLSIDEIVKGYVLLADQIRPEAQITIKDLQQNGIKNIAMITGDHKATAQKISSALQISKVYAECRPQDKIRLIEDTPKDERPLIMVGDGVNDAPAIAAADVGIAMGATGASAASQTADVVIVKNDLHTILNAIEISRYTMKIARESVMIGIVICIVLELICATGVVPVIIGALLQEVVDTASILWALRARVSKEKLKKASLAS
ncbi:heavy metal translocating P-type ATPase [Xylocopilactobacillus apicola]|uniref:Cd(2+)-exporting ATPase n=1 Tax=Xylocopilactobacillus apicola TaxID=2932184 RepID=A0AAU9DGE1_9LACO|nr:heavy metal translocating P-type ATPase [Xylocopilactobacillus apicola]BDR59025.1 cobalt ABC transporter ATP-binding protein [Xylocopilactobacillus apicola]